MSKITASARNQPCQIRIPGVCCGDPATTVACHYRLAGLAGISKKPDDLFIAWGCANCHDAVDGRRFLDLEHDYLRHCHAEGVFRTQAKLLEKGLVRV